MASSLANSTEMNNVNSDIPAFTFKNLLTDKDAVSTTLPESDPATSSASMQSLDSRTWATPSYLSSQIKNSLAARLHDLLDTKCESTCLEKETILRALERPKKGDEHGHLCLPCPQLRIQGVNPMQMSQDLAAKMLNQEGESMSSSSSISLLVQEVQSTGPFVNFKLNPGYFVPKAIQEILSLGSMFGMSNIGHGRRIGIDYSAPNIAKPFHAGHVRSTIIGNFIKHLYAAAGFDCVGINYLGDWGKQYGLLALGYLKYGKEETLKEDPIKHLFNVYVAINRDMEQDPSIDDQARAYFKRMEDGDQEALSLWRRFRDLSIVKYKQVYARLNIFFELYSGESLYQDQLPLAIDMLQRAGILEDSQGAKTINLEEWKLGRALIVKKDGTSIYMSRDIAAAYDRFTKMHMDKLVYVVACQQDLHLAQLFRIYHLLGKHSVVPEQWFNNMVHVNFGMVRGMKTRKGEVKFLEEILDEAKEVMQGVMRQNPDKYAEIENPERTSDILAVSAVMIQDMSAKRIKDYDFKLERVTQFEGDTGPYLQYAHSRLCSIERKFLDREQIASSELDLIKGVNLELLTEKEAGDLMWHCVQYPEILQECRLNFEPCTLVSYLITLSQLVSSTINKLWVMGQEKELALARLAMYRAARIVLGNGLRILGLVPLERM